MINLGMAGRRGAGIEGDVRMEFGDQNGSTDRKVLDEILSIIRQIKYGEVVVTIHDSTVVQIEKREKKRFQR